MCIQQSLMRVMKIDGGLTYERGKSDCILLKWIARAPETFVVQKLTVLNKWNGKKAGKPGTPSIDKH